MPTISTSTLPRIWKSMSTKVRWLEYNYGYGGWGFVTGKNKIWLKMVLLSLFFYLGLRTMHEPIFAKKLYNLHQSKIVLANSIYNRIHWRGHAQIKFRLVEFMYVIRSYDTHLTINFPKFREFSSPVHLTSNSEFLLTSMCYDVCQVSVCLFHV